ncbi:hypothetical protein N2152v2_000342 [Parachlorella kessleri]
MVLLLLVSHALGHCRGQQGPGPSAPAAGPPAPQGAAAKPTARPHLTAARERTSITNETLPAVLRELATPDKQIVLAVVHLGEAQALDFLKNWALSLKAHGLLQHALIVAVDLGSTMLARAAGLPVLLDEASPTKGGPWTLRKQPIIVNRIYDLAKHWWGMRLVESGYSVLYCDVDMVFVKDPLPLLHSAPYDVQPKATCTHAACVSGLSDYFWPELPRLGEPLDRPCHFYKLVAEGASPTGTWDCKADLCQPGAQVREIWGLRGRDPVTALQVLNPCQSTGFWYLQPTAAPVAFMRAMVNRLWTLPWGWDQAAWQEVILAFLIGMGADEPLRFRLLAVHQFANTGVFEDRLKAKLPVDPYVIHCGAVNGFHDKMCALAKFNMWHPELWAGGSNPFALEVASVQAAAKVCRPPAAQQGQQAGRHQPQQPWGVANWPFPLPPTESDPNLPSITSQGEPEVKPEASAPKLWRLPGMAVRGLVGAHRPAAAAAAAGAPAPGVISACLVAAGLLLLLAGAGVALARRHGGRRGGLRKGVLPGSPLGAPENRHGGTM